MHLIVNYIPINNDEATMTTTMKRMMMTKTTCLEVECFFQTKANMRGSDSEELKNLKENTIV
jgi:hypothetical protein